MGPKKTDRLVPEQRRSLAKDLHATSRQPGQEEADDLFLTAKDRLLDVRHWQDLAGAAGASFALTDASGHEVHRPAHTGDYIRIRIPGPGHAGGDATDDWVHIELIRYDDFPDENRESIGMRVRPSRMPGSNEEAPAHFFSEEASSTLIVERIGSTVMAHYHGRNEVPNTGTDNLADKARNTLVAPGALAGFSDLQWKALLEGLIATGEN